MILNHNTDWYAIIRESTSIERVLDEVTVEIPGYRGLTINDAFQAQAQFTEAQRVSYQARRDYAKAKERLRETMDWIE